MHALTTAAERGRTRSSPSSACRASARRPPRGSGASSASPRSTGCKSAAEGAAARPLGPRREDRGEDPQGARGGCRRGGAAPRRLLGVGAADRARGRRGARARTRPRSTSPRRAACGVGARPFRDLDVIATATDPAALIARSRRCRGSQRSSRTATRRRPSSRTQGFRLDLRVVPPECYGNLLQHFTGSKDHNVALREDAVRRGLSVSEYGVTVVETGEVTRFATEEELYASSATRSSRPSCARTTASSRRPATDELPALVELGDLRGELHCHSTWSADGKGRSRRWRTAREPRLQVPRPHRPLALPARRAHRGAVAGDRGGQRAAGAVPRAARHRGEHPRRRVGRRRRRHARRARLGRRVAHTAFDSSPTERILARSTTRTSTASATSRVGGSSSAPAPTSTSSGSSSARSRPAPRSRSTRSRTGSTCATRTPGSPGRRAC